MSKEITVTLGSKPYTVIALPIAASKAWREALAGPFGEIADALTQANTVEVHRFADIAVLVRQMSGVLLGSVDKMLDLLFSYSPALAAERQWIEENAYDEEALHAFAEVLKLAFPFGVLLEVVTGRMATRTLPNSPSPNGVSPLPASGPVRKDKTKR
jgi:hypothetical protein